MVPIKQRAPASPGHPLTHTPAQQGLEDTELPGSFPGQASPTYFWEAGSCLVRVDPARAVRCLPGPGSAGLTLLHAPNSPGPYSRCLPALPAVSHPWVARGELTPLWACRAAREPPAEPGRC